MNPYKIGQWVKVSADCPDPDVAGRILRVEDLTKSNVWTQLGSIHVKFVIPYERTYLVRGAHGRFVKHKSKLSMYDVREIRVKYYFSLFVYFFAGMIFGIMVWPK